MNKMIKITRTIHLQLFHQVAIDHCLIFFEVHRIRDRIFCKEYVPKSKRNVLLTLLNHLNFTCNEIRPLLLPSRLKYAIVLPSNFRLSIKSK
jgi:hypothetical protein